METAATLTIECHPPERRRRTDIRMCHGSCCCCCCCLHTIGGIVGAVIAPNVGGKAKASAWSHLSLIEHWEEEDYTHWTATSAGDGGDAITEDLPTPAARPIISAGPMPDIARPGVSAVKIFWLLSLAAAILGTLIGLVQGRGLGGLVIGMVIVLMVFPAVQLVCAIITLFFVGFSSRLDRSFQLKQVGKITLGLFLGTLGGIGVMACIAGIMSAR